MIFTEYHLGSQAVLGTRNRAVSMSKEVFNATRPTLPHLQGNPSTDLHIYGCEGKKSDTRCQP